VGSAALILALALAGAGILVSRDALPGEGLYGVKRVAEAAGLALIFDETSRARRHLDLASTRLGEVEQLVAADPKVSSEDPQLVTEAIQQFDDSAGEGARIMLAGDNADSSGARDELRSWAAEQSSRLAGLQPALPAGTGAEDAMQLLNRVVGRTAALQQQAACATPPSSVDDLGPVPSCQPAGVEMAGVDPTTGLPGTATDPAAAGAAGDPTTAGSSAGTDARGTAGSSTSSGAGSSRQAPAEPDDPSLLDPVEDTLGGVLGGGSKDTQSSSSPSSSDDDRKSSDNDGGGGGLPPVEVPPLLPGLPGIGIG
jgi:hypothetical protein